MSQYQITPNLMATGNILPSSLVIGDPSNAFSALQSGFNGKVIGVSGPGTVSFPDNSSSSTQYAAINGTPCVIYGFGSQVQCTLGATMTPFQSGKSDASGFLIPASAGDNVCAIPFTGGVNLDIVQVLIVPGGLVAGGSAGSGAVGTLFASKTAATAQNTYTTGISIVTGMTGNGSLTLPANYLTVGKVLRVSGYGLISDTSTPTFLLTLKLATVSLCATQATTLGSSITNRSFSFTAYITCIAVGPTSTVLAGGTANLGGTIADMVLATAASVPTTATALVDVFGAWSASSSSNSVQLQGLTVESLN